MTSYYKKLLASISHTGYSLKKCHELKCIFVHVPRTAGTSISQTLFNHHVGHHKLCDYKNIYSAKQLQQYFKFAIVRNPWSKIVSSYFYLKEGGFGLYDKNWFADNLGGFKNFNSFINGWITTKKIYASNHFIPQHDYIVASGLKLDFIGYFEDIDASFAHIKTKLGLNCTLQHTNSRKKADCYKQYFDKESRDIVAKIYAQDIKLLGYNFDGNNKPWINKNT